AHFNAQAPPGTAQPHVLVNKAAKMLNAVQDRLNFQLHGWSFGLVCSIAGSKRLNKLGTSFFAVGHCATLPCGSGDRALQECNLSTGPSVDCSDCIPPGSGRPPEPGVCFGDATASHGQSEKLIHSLSAVRPPFLFCYPQILLQTQNFIRHPIYTAICLFTGAGVASHWSWGAGACGVL